YTRATASIHVSALWRWSVSCSISLRSRTSTLLRRLRIECVKFLIGQRAYTSNLGRINNREVLHPEKEPGRIVPDLCRDLAVEFLALLRAALFFSGVDPGVNLRVIVKRRRSAAGWS